MDRAAPAEVIEHEHQDIRKEERRIRNLLWGPGTPRLHLRLGGGSLEGSLEGSLFFLLLLLFIFVTESTVRLLVSLMTESLLLLLLSKPSWIGAGWSEVS